MVERDVSMTFRAKTEGAAGVRDLAKATSELSAAEKALQQSQARLTAGARPAVLAVPPVDLQFRMVKQQFAQLTAQAQAAATGLRQVGVSGQTGLERLTHQIGQKLHAGHRPGGKPGIHGATGPPELHRLTQQIGQKPLGDDYGVLGLPRDTELNAGGDGLRRLGQAADSARAQSDQLFSSVQSHLAEMKTQAAAAGEALKMTFRSGVDELDRLNDKIGQFDQQFRRVAKAGLVGNLVGVNANRLDVKKEQGALGNVAGMLGLPSNLASLAGAFGALTASVKASDAALKICSQSFYRGQFHEGAFADTVLRGIQAHTPQTIGTAIGEDPGARNSIDALMGLWKGFATFDLSIGKLKNLTKQFYSGHKEGETAEDRTSLNVRNERTANLAENAAQTARTQRIRTEEYLQYRPLRQETAQRNALLKFGHTSDRDTFAIEQKARAYQYNSFGKAGQKLGYGREAELADIALRTRTHAGYLQASAEGKRQQGILGAKQREAAGNVEQQKAAYGDQLNQVSIARRDLNRAYSPETEQNARLTLERQYADLLEKENRLKAAMAEKLALDREAIDQSLGLQRQKVSLVRAEGDAIAQARREEQGLIRSQKESLGLMHPATLRTTLGVARKNKAGIPLSQGEIKFMESHSQIFGQQLQEIGMNRFNAKNHTGDMMRELSRLTGFASGARMKQLDKLQVANDVRVRVELGTTDAIMNQLQKSLLPQLNEMEKRIKNEINDRISRDMNLSQANRRAMTQ